ncbi:MAG: hypothetical protein OEV70_14675, partial [Nitrospirota bacterium]|nr:hypothetical protein [Nitrospirota bacterium]
RERDYGAGIEFRRGFLACRWWIFAGATTKKRERQHRKKKAQREMERNVRMVGFWGDFFNQRGSPGHRVEDSFKRDGRSPIYPYKITISLQELLISRYGNSFYTVIGFLPIRTTN